MSDSSHPPSSSPSSSDNASRRASPHAALAFLVHSPNTVANHLPPDVDNRPLARQKRRRTSKEDEEILKAEYLSNPKPDKAARLQIVTKVALGEKEVQIWFQNKRQNDRRRSRPVDSSSSVALMSESSTMSDPASEDGASSQEKESVEGQNVERCSEETAQPEASEARLEEHPTPPAAEPSPAGELAESAATTKTESQSTVESIAAPLPDSVASTEAPTADTAPTELGSSQQAISSSQGAPQPRGSWISNRRSASFRYTEEYSHESIAFPNPTPSTEPSSSTRALKRTHSFVRLSMADDGTARVITDADKTPSPPHGKTNPATFSSAAAGLRRSYSAAGLNERLAAASQGEPSPKMPRTASTVGRSRDSRAWEFWCDPDTRNSRSLTTRANQEGSGSAADAIGLLRANRRVLSQNQLRQNAPVLSRGDSAKALSRNSVKKPRPSMQRALTSQGRLQTKHRKAADDELDDIPQTESDKENWEPEGQKMHRPRKQGASFSQRPREVLGENPEIMSQSSSLGAMMAREKRRTSGAAGENSDSEQDDELRYFMNGGDMSARSNLSSAEEAGCVEGLLKLSQGNWR